MPGLDMGILLADLLSAVQPGRREAFVPARILRSLYAEAVMVVGCPAGTVRSHVARALRMLMASLEDPDGQVRRAAQDSLDRPLAGLPLVQA
ncbi:hypothetical protein [Streptomyces sp. NPDC059166]|uniref:hypothetical protein n=1 Tax=Streptomyces sp. NPDC059166 TaxID=3346752 RepID=UPI0036A81E37